MNRGARTVKRRVAVVTGTRAEYGLLKSTMEAISKHPSLKLQTVACGIHLLRRFGHTIDEIINDGWHIDGRVRMQSGDDAPLDQSRGLARGISGLADFFERASTDVVVVLGDRIEALAGAMAAVTTGRLVAHIHGGDRATGDIDEGVRHAITKMAHIHFAASKASQRRIIRMGEETKRVHCVGAPGLDRLRHVARERRPTAEKLNQAIVLFHPVGRSALQEERAMAMILEAVAQLGIDRQIIYPNSDRGHDGIIKAIRRHVSKHRRDQCSVVRSLAHDDFLRMLISSRMIVGNSSAGLIEAPSAGTAAVDIGSRQAGRQIGGRSVIQVPEKRVAIAIALKQALRKRPIMWGTSVYGKGVSGGKIASHIARMPIGETARRKLNTF